MLDTLKSYLTKPSTYVLILIGIVIASAYARFVPSVLKQTAAKLPGAGAS
jgi:hypothetical protein